MSKDVIYRQEAIDALIDRFATLAYWNPDVVIDTLKKVPTAQPEIVRCKDCKYQVKEWRDDKRFKDKGYWVYGCEVISDACGYWAWFGQDDEFCSDAERRTDGSD